MKFFFFIALLFFSLLLNTSAQKYVDAQKTPWNYPPYWASLKRYDNTITAAQLEQLLQTVYVPDSSWKSWITITAETAFIEPYPGAEQRIALQLAPSSNKCKPVPSYFIRMEEPKPLQGKKEKPLSGLKIVLDPGHLGGSWSKMEERWFCIGHTRPVEEGIMTLFEAQLLAKRLRALGAIVQLTRSYLSPTTPLRPWQLRRAAIYDLKHEGHSTWTAWQLRKRAEMLFYRTAEIHHRAERVNQEWKPDLVICLHFDAEEWGDPIHPQLVDSNRLHILISGNFNKSELQKEEDRYVMLRKLLARVHKEEVGVANAITKAFETTTTLPPFTYHNPLTARPALDSNPYLWNRNLLATRLMEAPTILCEAYSMNDPLVFKRIQRGDYDGMQVIDGKKYPSIYREYANAVTRGLINYFAY